MSQWTSLRDRAAGRWQLPLLAVSLILMIGALLRIRPAPTDLPFNESITYIDRLVAGRVFGDAIALGDVLLSREEYTDAQRAKVHLRAARARYGEAERLERRGDDIGYGIVGHYEKAQSFSLQLFGEDFEIMGRALEWQDKYSRALEQYQKALDVGVPQHLDLRRHMLSLMIDHLEVPPELLGERLDRFVEYARDTRLDLTLWAIERKLAMFDRQDTLDQAATLLTRHREPFQTSSLRDRFAFLEAWLLHRNGHFDEAERYLRTVRNRLDTGDVTFGMTGWLLGQAVMADGGPQRPQEALSFYESVLKYYTGTPFGIASRIGSAEALVMLQRDAEALDMYRTAIDEMLSLGDLPASGIFPELVSREALRVSLGVMSDVQRKAGRLQEAVGYARLAVSLLDSQDVERATLFLEQLAQTQSLFADELDGGALNRGARSNGLDEAVSERARAMFAEAASTFLRLAQLTALTERLAERSSWQAAELFARAGERDQAAVLFRAFARERPNNALVPRALLRIGQLRQALGQLTLAVEAYQECYRRFPRTLDGARALVPMARCYLAMGSDFDDLAEKTLFVVLEESEVFTPQAPEFADASFLLGDALNRRGDFERAIATLEEVLERYSDDPRAARARFLLADSSLRSGLTLKADLADAKYAGEIEQIRAESTTRFEAARQGYRALIEEYESRDPNALNRLERVYLRHAFLYEADSYFETGDYRQALRLYEEAAGMYKDTPSALAAYVQIINTHVFLEQRDEARAALARALVLVDTLPESAFEDSVSPEDRTDWQRYFEWLGQSGLF